MTDATLKAFQGSRDLSPLEWHVTTLLDVLQFRSLIYGCPPDKPFIFTQAIQRDFIFIN